jgi:hypothetical protein
MMDENDPNLITHLESEMNYMDETFWTRMKVKLQSKI